MLPNRAFRALRISSSRQCPRQLHSTPSQRADEAAAAAAAAATTPPRRAGRKERSTLISNEVSKLQQGPPAQAQQPSAPTTSAGFLETPPSPGGRMGQNEPAEREGPLAQGIASPSAMTEPSEGGVDVLSASAPGRGEVAMRSSRSSKVPKAAGRAYVPVGFTKEELLRSGEGTATIAGGNFGGVVEDRFHQIVEPGRRAGGEVSRARDSQKDAQGQMIRIRRSPTQKGKMAKNLLTEEARKVVVGKLVQGRFDGSGVLAGKRKTPPNALDEVKKRLLLNGTYLRSDARKLVEKVQGFLTKEQWAKLQTARGS